MIFPTVLHFHIDTESTRFWDFAVLMFYEMKLSFFLVTIFYNHFD